MTSIAAQALNQFLHDHDVGKITTIINNQQSNVIELDSNLSPIEAAKILWSHNLVGAPVWDDKHQKYIGYFEMRDILSSVIAAAKAETDDEYQYDALDMNQYNERMVKELDTSTTTNDDQKKTFADVKPDDKTISYLAARNYFNYVKPDASLIDLCECLNQRDCHRVPILNEDGKCQNIVSQSALIKYISDHCSHDLLQESIVEAGIPYKKDVVQIIDTAPATEAFTLLDNKRLSGIAVVDEDGKLVGNTSARDIKLAAFDEGKTAMDMDILSYLAKVRQAVKQKKERYPTCHVHEDASVAHVIDSLAKTGYHRVFVVDENVRLIGVISVSDITTFALKDPDPSRGLCC